MVWERARARGLGAPGRWLKEGALSKGYRPSRAGFQEPKERSASAPQVRMRCNAKTADSACECQTANERCAHENRTANDWRARRQFVSKCPRALWPTCLCADYRRKSRYDTRTDCDRVFDPKIVCKAQVGCQSN
mgnify:CR=1 FL=1